MTARPTAASALLARLRLPDVRSAIARLERGLADAESVPAPTNFDEVGLRAKAVCLFANEAYNDAFGREDARAQEAQATTTRFYFMEGTPQWSSQDLAHFESARREVLEGLRNQIRLLNGKLTEDAQTVSRRPLLAYDSLDLHEEIANAAGQLFRNGHYAHAVQDAVKALNGLVRVRSGRDDLDGTTLMETVFSLRNPILVFNELSDRSDEDEQKGFMMMFSGAVAGLRNPRAHKFIEDDPERALEFIAFVSLLAKLLAGAERRR